jgi:hypothetical protein
VAEKLFRQERVLVFGVISMMPRGMSREDAAAYAGCATLSAFNDWVRRGIMPRPIPGTHKWDRKAIDAALDRLSGLQSTIAPAKSAYDECKVAQNAREY